MKKIFIFIFFLTLSLSSFCQDQSNGVYYFDGFDVSHRLNLMPDSSMIKCVSGWGNRSTNYVGKWKQIGDTIIVIEKLVDFRQDSVMPEADTSYFKICSTLLLKEILPKLDFYLPFHKQLEYHSNGKIKTEIKCFTSSPFDGIITSYYSNGLIDEITYYEKGMKHGQYLKYNEMGILIVSGCYRKNKEVDDWRYYNAMGLLEEVKNKNK